MNKDKSLKNYELKREITRRFILLEFGVKECDHREKPDDHGITVLVALSREEGSEGQCGGMVCHLGEGQDRKKRQGALVSTSALKDIES